MSNELRPMRPMASSFDIKELQADNMVNTLNSFRNNGKAEIITQDSRGKYYCYSGDNISLAELKGHMPENIFNNAAAYDVNQDGFLTEKELLAQKPQKKAGEEIAKWGLGACMLGAIVGSTKLGAVAGTAVGAAFGGVGAVPGVVVGAVAGAIVGVGIGIVTYNAHDKKENAQQAGAYLPEITWQANNTVKIVL